MKNGYYLLPVFSGYKNSDWAAFLRKWLLLCKTKGRSGSLVDGFLEKQEKPDFRAAEERLGVKLPRSYKEFLSVCNPESTWIDALQDGVNSYMLPLSRIDFLKKIEKEIYEVAQKEGFDSSDGDYFRYHPSASGNADKSSFYEKMIVLGRTSENDLIIINPMVRSLDGELETQFFTPTYSCRAISFAVMMKNIYLYEVAGFDSYPLYDVNYVNSVAEIDVAYPYEDYEKNKILNVKWIDGAL